jgi:hypothetical protein
MVAVATGGDRDIIRMPVPVARWWAAGRARPWVRSTHVAGHPGRATGVTGQHRFCVQYG